MPCRAVSLAAATESTRRTMDTVATDGALRAAALLMVANILLVVGKQMCLTHVGVTSRVTVLSIGCLFVSHGNLNSIG